MRVRSLVGLDTHALLEPSSPSFSSVSLEADKKESKKKYNLRNVSHNSEIITRPQRERKRNRESVNECV